MILLILGAINLMNDEDYCGRTELLEAKEDKLSLGHHQHVWRFIMALLILYLSTEQQQQPQ